MAKNGGEWLVMVGDGWVMIQGWLNSQNRMVNDG